MHPSLFYKRLLICLTIVCLFFKEAKCQLPVIDSIITPSSLQQLVQVLASDSFMGRFTGTSTAAKAADFIAGEFKKAGVAPLEMNEGYFMPFGFGLGNGLNVMAELKGKTKPEEVIIFCAHYDHVGTKSTNPNPGFVSGAKPRARDTIFNGANDNASGTSAVINLARYFGQLKTNHRTILFIAFSGEELDLLGSKALASTLTDNPEHIKAVINIEMIGRRRSKKKNNAYITGSHLSDLQPLLNQNLLATDPAVYGRKFFVDDVYADQNLFSRSDNYWFAQKGIPAHTIMSTSPKDKFYHSQADEPATLDFSLMSNLVKAIAIGCQGLIDGTDTPKRINPSRIPE